MFLVHHLHPPTSFLFRLYYSYLNDRLHLPVLGGVSSSSSFTTMMRPTAKERRVRFQQETKSQSLDTPYHHTHEQQKLDMDMDSDTMAERSNSFTAISQCYTSDKGKDNLQKFYLLPYVLSLLVLHCLDCIESPEYFSWLYFYIPSFF